MVKAPTPVEPTSSIVVHAVGTPSPARRSRPVSDARLPPAACGIGRIARDPSRRCASPRLPARCWRTHSGDGEPWLLTSESPAKSHRVRRRTLFPPKKKFGGSPFSHFSRCRAVERSTLQVQVLEDAPKHVRPCMHACTCMHTCLHEENEEGSLQRVQVYSESSRKQFLGACRQCRVHAEPSARVNK